MTPLRQLLIDAASAFSTYRNPSISEAKAQINALLLAAKMPGIENDTVDDIDISTTSDLVIDVSWVSMGCSDRDSYRLPAFVIDADDPIKAATIYGINKAIEKVEARKRQAERDLASANTDFRKLQSDLFKALQ